MSEKQVSKFLFDLGLHISNSCHIKKKIIHVSVSKEEDTNAHHVFLTLFFTTKRARRAPYFQDEEWMMNLKALKTNTAPKMTMCLNGRRNFLL